MRRAAVALLVLVACKGQEHTGGAMAGATFAPPDAAAAMHTARAAVRCRECHGEIAEQWRDSGHAHAADSPIYLAMREKDATCDRCHAPLRGLVPASLAVIEEGVTCDVCHTIPRVVVEGSAARFSLDLDANLKYGPLCDAQPHYFHGSSCTAQFRESSYCAACHRWSPSAHLPVFTEYDEWRDSHQEMQCQGCHMPGRSTQVATGFHTRESVPHHGFLGRGHELRQRAVSGTASFAVRDGRLHAEVELANDAGHDVPAGLPGRQLVLRVRVLDGQGRELDVSERAYQRLLVDADGAEAPFTRAVAQKEDTRLLPDKTRQEVVELALPMEAASVEALVEWRALSPALASRLRVTAPTEAMLRAAAPVGKLPAKLPFQAVKAP